MKSSSVTSQIKAVELCYPITLFAFQFSTNGNFKAFVQQGRLRLTCFGVDDFLSRRKAGNRHHSRARVRALERELSLKLSGDYRGAC